MGPGAAMKRCAFAFVALFLFAGCAKVQGDALCVDVVKHRNDHGAIVHLFGDSIARGRALDNYEDGDRPLDARHPLYRFRSIASTANWALEHNGRPERFAYCGAIDAELIASRVASGVIRAGDTVVLEDAGNYQPGVAAYYRFLLDARHAAEAPGVTVVMMTMFDYCVGSNMACANADAQYDRPRRNGPDDTGTLNAATRGAATVRVSPQRGRARGRQPGRTVLIDMNAIMDDWRSTALTADGVTVMDNDGVHPNVWGQMKMTQHILAAARLRPYITDVDPLQDLAEENHPALSYGSTTFSPARARVYVAEMLDGG